MYSLQMFIFGFFLVRFLWRRDLILPISFTLKESFSFPNSSWTVVVVSRIACTDSSIFKTSVLLQQSQLRKHVYGSEGGLTFDLL